MYLLFYFLKIHSGRPPQYYYENYYVANYQALAAGEIFNKHTHPISFLIRFPSNGEKNICQDTFIILFIHPVADELKVIQ